MGQSRLANPDDAMEMKARLPQTRIQAQAGKEIA